MCKGGQGPLGQEQRGSQDPCPLASLDPAARAGPSGPDGRFLLLGRKRVALQTLLGFCFLPPAPGREAGRAGCKPCPWNLPSQLRPKMSKTPDGERRGGEERSQGMGSLQAAPLESRDPKREEAKKDLKSSQPAQFVVEERGGRWSTKELRAVGWTTYY